MKRDISLELPNEYGTFLSEILKPIDITAYNWKIGAGESYKVIHDKLGEDLFDARRVMTGAQLEKHLKLSRQYFIFVDLKAFNGIRIEDIHTYEGFLESSCEIILLVVDSCDVTIYCKNQVKLELLYENSRQLGFHQVSYITDESDTRTSLSAW
ncbi:DUF2691 family protein [Rossellomorea vietnamensis]|uniref:DUF2691 family protein n=1 Tax=Rossellomorea vietnamensis TaxID=218284 RepID=A0A5D4MHH7_9BACI|nr:DUF2691 family protein [Rossellomorea vietnamensis]TYS01355.1 DUF2691 family protein [Rossellomorea vietnamensis]